MTKYYPLGDRIPNVASWAQKNYRAKLTGEFRPPKAGEWYLSGSIPLAYRMPSDGSTMSFNIVKVVAVETITVIREVPAEV